MNDDLDNSFLDSKPKPVQRETQSSFGTTKLPDGSTQRTVTRIQGNKKKTFYINTDLNGHTKTYSKTETIKDFVPKVNGITSFSNRGSGTRRKACPPGSGYHIQRYNKCVPDFFKTDVTEEFAKVRPPQR